MAATGLAIRLYEIDHGRRPERLADLVPEYLPAVPDDPMDARRKISYLPRAKRPLLYSVGENGTDEGGAKVSHKPLALASALKKLEFAAKNKPMRQGNPSTAHMFIVNPFQGVRIAGLFSTHPPTQQRVDRLENLAKTL